MNTEIATLGTLFTVTWEQYKKRALPLLAVMLISAVLLGSVVMALALGASFGGAVLTHFTDERTATLLLTAAICLLVLLLAILIFWVQTSLLALVVNEDLGIIEAFQTGWTYLWPMTWVFTLFSGIMITGFLLGILPGILCAVWFSFCMFILLDEDRRGLDALLVSREYVRGHWWNTCGKLLVLWLISAAAGLIPFVGQVFSLLFTPFFMLFLLAMYRNLKEVKGEVAVETGTGARIFWWALAVIGLLLPLAALTVAIYSALVGDQSWLQFPHGMHGELL